MKKKVTIVVECAENNFSAYVREVDGIAVTGDSPDTIKFTTDSAEIEYQECRKVADKMLKYPATFEEALEQVRRNRENFGSGQMKNPFESGDRRSVAGDAQKCSYF